MRLMGAGLALMLLGLAALFAMVVHADAPPLPLSIAAFAATFAGMLLALIGLAQRLQRR